MINKHNALLLLVMTIAGTLVAQENSGTKTDSLNTDLEIETENTGASRNHQNIILNSVNSEEIELNSVEVDAEVDPNIANTISGVRGDFYDIDGTYKLHNDLYVYNRNKKDQVLGIGEYYFLTLGIRWISNDKLTFFANGLFITEIDALDGKVYYRFGGHAGFDYSITERLTFKAEGQYLAGSKGNPFVGNHLFEQSNVGASLMYKVSPKVKVGVNSRHVFDNPGAKNITGGSVKVGF